MSSIWSRSSNLLKFLGSFLHFFRMRFLLDRGNLNWIEVVTILSITSSSIISNPCRIRSIADLSSSPNLSQTSVAVIGSLAVYSPGISVESVNVVDFIIPPNSFGIQKNLKTHRKISNKSPNRFQHALPLVLDVYTFHSFSNSLPIAL